MDHDKYIVFKRTAFYEMMGELALPPFDGPAGQRAGEDWECAPMAESITTKAEAAALPDAVVIRRQDIFAAPALHTYYNSIGVALSVLPGTNGVHKRLQEVADFFHEQATLADSTDFRKLPD